MYKKPPFVSYYSRQHYSSNASPDHIDILSNVEMISIGELGISIRHMFIICETKWLCNHNHFKGSSFSGN
jgi:hypothetical protein